MEIKIEKLGKVAITVAKDFWSIDNAYDRLVIIEDEGQAIYLSKKPVPKGIRISNTTYWLKLCNINSQSSSTDNNFTDYYKAQLDTLISYIPAINTVTNKSLDIPLPTLEAETILNKPLSYNDQISKLGVGIYKVVNHHDDKLGFIFIIKWEDAQQQTEGNTMAIALGTFGVDGNGRLIPIPRNGDHAMAMSICYCERNEEEEIDLSWKYLFDSEVMLDDLTERLAAGGIIPTKTQVKEIITNQFILPSIETSVHTGIKRVNADYWYISSR